MPSRARKFFSYYLPYRGLLAVDVLCAFIIAAVTLLLPLCASFITQNLLRGDPTNLLPQIAGMGALMVGLVVVHTLCNQFVDYQGHMMGARMEADLRRDLFEHYQRLSFGFYDNQKTGQLMTRLTYDTWALSELYHHGPEDVAISLLKFIGVFAILATINLPLTLLIFVFLPFMAVFAFYFNHRVQLAMRASNDRVGDINARAEDALAGIRVVKSFTNEAQEMHTFAYENQRLLDSRSYVYRNEAYFSQGMGAATQLITIAVVVAGGVGIVYGTLNLADLVTYLLCVAIMIEPIQRAVNFARLYQEGLTGFNRVMDMMEIAPDVVERPGAHDPGAVCGGIRFEQVSFRYQPEQPAVLCDISLDVRPGEYIALVGPSGAGKTTLCSLIPRFYDIDGGAICLDGTDIRDLTLDGLRGAIGMVQQDVYLFAGTVAENIGYGQPGASREQIIAAAKQANAHSFIETLPQGYDTDIGQRGVKLSGGQKQRLSIARVFLKNPPVLIFDEATSSLDNESEQAVQAALETLASNRTTLAIAHRLSTVRNAQRIVVLADGRIAEQGTHDELLAHGGIYANLYTMQLRI